MRPAAVAILVAGALVSCNRAAPQPDASAATLPPAANPLLAQAREALLRAETAPIPTPPPPPSPLPRGWKPAPAPDLKPEEIEAIRLLEEAAAASPAQADVHELLAKTLEPHAVREHDRALAARGKKAPAPRPPDPGVDVSPARAVAAYRAAVEANPNSGLIGPMIAFAGRVGDLDAADWAHQEWIRRAKEKDTVTPRVLYGDFLRDQRKDLMAAAEQYRGALMWNASDSVTREKLAALYLDLAAQHFAKNEYAGAEVRLREAQKYVGDATSPEGQRYAEYRKRLSAIRR